MYIVMNYNLFIFIFTIAVVWETFILSRLQTSPKDTNKAAIIKYFNDNTVVFNNQIITGLLLLKADFLSSQKPLAAS